MTENDADTFWLITERQDGIPTRLDPLPASEVEILMQDDEIIGYLWGLR